VFTQGDFSRRSWGTAAPPKGKKRKQRAETAVNEKIFLGNHEKIGKLIMHRVIKRGRGTRAHLKGREAPPAWIRETGEQHETRLWGTMVKWEIVDGGEEIDILRQPPPWNRGRKTVLEGAKILGRVPVKALAKEGKKKSICCGLRALFR